MSQNILIRNHVTIRGEGERTMILAPGFGCDQTVWDAVCGLLEKEYKLILFDYVGMGKTDVTAFDLNKYSKLSGYVQDLLDVSAALDLHDAIFVGHSVSGMIGLLASLREPKYFSDVIMIGPSPCYVDDPPAYYGGFKEEDLAGLIEMMEKNYIGWSTMFAATVANNPNRLDVTKDLEERFCSTDPVVARTFAEACFFADNRQDLPQVSVPSLIMQCAEDIIAPATVGEYLNKHIPHSTLAFMDATGHCPHMSHPEETVQHIVAYLNQIPHHDGQKDFPIHE